ncbi:hypothetical protein BDA96_01G127000 [Sorghum bicolor]|uniref:Uncharacterized protein n=2 Tax=Sorghum bicolor TaxID=4558 RepID=A0A921RWX8_SORBI|nr:hypothetical protein SORBI_3001G121500 [Sorghum bicolor]KAG0547973.1 hypothetical protein BDA96_01G127000 [Sorghum bicolor]
MRRKDAKLLERIFFILRKNKVEKVGWQTVGDALSECTGKYVYGRCKERRHGLMCIGCVRELCFKNLGAYFL